MLAKFYSTILLYRAMTWNSNMRAKYSISFMNLTIRLYVTINIPTRLNPSLIQWN